MTETKPFVIAVDGPAASGKGTMSRRLASYYGLAYLDTGTLYRGVGWLMLARNLDPRDEPAAVEIAQNFATSQIADADIRTADVGRAASVVAAVPGVRAALFDFQRNFAMWPPGRVEGAILDGRDIGTVVYPEATVKFYITASPEVRAKRRYEELLLQDPSTDYEETLEQIKRRDQRDSSRESAPMRPAKDAEFIDTSTLDPDTVFARACRLIDKARAVVF